MVPPTKSSIVQGSDWPNAGRAVSKKTEAIFRTGLFTNHHGDGLIGVRQLADFETRHNGVRSRLVT